MIDQTEPAYKPLTVGDWIITILITFIPIVNLIMYFVWAFSSTSHPSKKTWAQASLIWLLISVVLSAIAFALFGATLLALAASSGQ